MGKTYCNNSEFQSELGLIEVILKFLYIIINSNVILSLILNKESESILAKKFPLNLHLFEDKSPLLSGTDFYHCIKKVILRQFLFKF